MIKILVCDPVAPEAVAKMQAAGFQVDIKTGLPPEELIATVPAYDAIIVRSDTKVRKPVIEAAKNMKIIARGGVGLDNVDVEVAKAKGIKVINTPGASSASVAELAVGMMLALARHIAQAAASTKSGKWEKKKYKGTEVGGKTLGIIGIGRIGQETAKRALGLEMKVIAYDKYIQKAPLANVKMVSLDELLKTSDYISLHIPYVASEGTTLGAAEFAKMKKGVRIVNCARGGVLDEKALLSALQSGQVTAAAMDVFETEPPGQNPLLALDNFIATPHIGASTTEGQFRVGIEVAEKLIEEFKKL